MDEEELLRIVNEYNNSVADFKPPEVSPHEVHGAHTGAHYKAPPSGVLEDLAVFVLTYDVKHGAEHGARITTTNGKQINVCLASFKY